MKTKKDIWKKKGIVRKIKEENCQHSYDNFFIYCTLFRAQTAENEEKRKGTKPYTRQHQSRAGGQGQCSICAGAVTEICSPFCSKRPKTRSDYGRTDGRTDGLTW